MFKALIVDDDIWVRRGLTATIDWEALGFELAGEAEDGAEGLEKCLRLLPDLVITDVKMPCMTGVEMMERLCAAPDFDGEFLLLSGYNDFDYVKRAMELGAHSYLLKPVKNADVTDACLKIKASLEKKRKARSDYVSLSSKVEFLKNQFIISLLSGELKTDDVEERMRFYDFRPPRGAYFVMSARTDDAEAVAVSEEFYRIRCVVDRNNLAAVVFFSGGEPPMAYLEAFARTAGVQCVGASRPCAALTEMPNLYCQALDALAAGLDKGARVSLYAPGLGAPDGFDHDLAAAAAVVIKELYASQISIADVAKRLNVSASHLMHVFKSDRGQTIGEFLTEYRMERAMELIRQNKYKIYEVCALVGYKDAKHFRNTFKAFAGVSPAGFQKSLHKLT
jgi:two-component system response regulator YesN